MTAAVLAASTLVAACGGPPPVVTRPVRPDYQSADLATLVEIANGWTAASLRAVGQLRLFWAGNEDDRHVDARLFAARSGALYMQGDRTMAGNIFQLAGDGVDFWLRIPSQQTDYLGSSSAPAEPDPERPYFALRPHHVTEALLPEPLPSLTDGTRERVGLEVYPNRYGVSWWQRDETGRLALRRRVWIERAHLRVVRVEAFRGGGRIDFIATYGDYGAGGRDAYPGFVQVERPWEELVFRFDLKEVLKNPSLQPGLFSLSPTPPGYRSMTIEEAMKEAHDGEAQARRQG